MEIQFTTQIFKEGRAALWSRFSKRRATCDHMDFTKPDVLRPVVIPKYAVPSFAIKNNLRTAGITRERDFALLGET